MNYSETLGFVYRQGTLAFLDSFSGLVPVRVLSVPQHGPFSGWVVHPEDSNLTIQVTAERKGYKRGEVLKADAFRVVPRNHVVRRSQSFRIVKNYSWENLTK